MSIVGKGIEGLDRVGMARLVVDFWHRTAMHHAMWFAEVRHQLGREKAWEILEEAFEKSYGIQVKRLSKTLGVEVEEGIPKPLLDLSEEKLRELLEASAVNWLANDGVWFQAVEFKRGMFDAKRCNDSCWMQFSPFEAWSVRRYLGLSENAGLEGLKRALDFRLYAAVNRQAVEDERGGFVFRMVDCRVQAARKRKGLEDYPCKSGGMAEYTSFAEAIDPRIRTECLGCPPDKHPEEWYCSWRFTLREK